VINQLTVQHFLRFLITTAVTIPAPCTSRTAFSDDRQTAATHWQRRSPLRSTPRAARGPS